MSKSYWSFNYCRINYFSSLLLTRVNDHLFIYTKSFYRIWVDDSNRHMPPHWMATNYEHLSSHFLHISLLAKHLRKKKGLPIDEIGDPYFGIWAYFLSRIYHLAFIFSLGIRDGLFIEYGLHRCRILNF